MVLPVLKYGHPILRQRGAPLERVTPEIRRLIDDMLDTMRAARGIGLAAQQIGRALRLTVLDVREVTDRPSSLEFNGNPVEVADFMPMILINPEISPIGEPVAGPEGCLSFPEMYADIPRPESVEVRAMNEKFSPVTFKSGGLLARAIQHELDHLNGILFIDRMSPAKKRELKSELLSLQEATKETLRALSSSK
jgi:peptide deformylase